MNSKYTIFKFSYKFKFTKFMSNLYIQIPLIKFSKFLPLPYPVKIRKIKLPERQPKYSKLNQIIFL